MNDNIEILLKDDFPITLKNMPGAPSKFFIRGKLPTSPEHKYLCVVGSRHPSTYGIDACRKLLTGLKGYPISIISGLAIGIDSYSHKVALEVGLNCIGFPGSSLEWDRIYPRTSIPLAKDIVTQGGTLLSEYGSDFVYADWAFPSRNRHMAGIAHATLVIEAKKRSGSLMTAKYAENFDRDLLTVPGSIFSEMTYGPHMLLKGCANPATTSEDILNILGFEVSKNTFRDNPTYGSLDDTSKRIIQEIAKAETTVDRLRDSLHLDISELNEKLSNLELEGIISVREDVLHLP